METKQAEKPAAAASHPRCKSCDSSALIVRPAVGAVCADCGRLQLLAAPALTNTRAAAR